MAAVLRDAAAPGQRALVLVNQPLVHGWRALWEAAGTRACADGGANRLHDALPDAAERARYLPSFVTGDLDSLRPDVRAFYEAHGVRVTHDASQDTTDLTKCMGQLPADAVVAVLGALSGRLDHIMQALHFLHEHSGRRVVLVSDDSLAMLLPAGEHTIEVLRELEGPTCGVVPLTGPTRITTEGLKWNLSDDLLWGFGHHLSTSNSVLDWHVRIRTDRPLLWTIERVPGAPLCLGAALKRSAHALG